MEVNLKMPQDVGANSHPSSIRQGGFSVASSPETLKKTAEDRPKTAKVVPLKFMPKDATETEAVTTAQQASLSKEELETVTTDLTELMQSLNTDIQFSIHESSGRMMVRVVDSKTHDVLKEFPPEELLDTIGAIREYVGALLDKKA